MALSTGSPAAPAAGWNRRRYALLSFMKHTILAAGIVGASLGASAAAQPPRAYPPEGLFPQSGTRFLPPGRRRQDPRLHAAHQRRRQAAAHEHLRPAPGRQQAGGRTAQADQRVGPRHQQFLLEGRRRGALPEGLRRRRELPRAGGGRQDRQGHRPDPVRRRARQHRGRPRRRPRPHPHQPQPARPAGVRRLPRQRAHRRRRAGGAEPRQHRRLADRPRRQGARRRHQRRPEHHPALPRRRSLGIPSALHHRLPHQRQPGLLHLRRQSSTPCPTAAATSSRWW